MQKFAVGGATPTLSWAGAVVPREGVGRSAIIRKAALATFRADYPRSTKASKLLQNSCTTGVSTEGRAGRGGGCCPLTSQQVTGRRFGDLFNILLQFASASKFIIGSIRVCRGVHKQTKFVLH